MANGLTINLCCLALAVWLMGVLQLRRIMPFFASSSIAAIKVVIPLVYFAWFCDGSWTFLDDITYFTSASEFVEAGFNPFTLFFNNEQLIQLYSSSGGFHILYLWWNILAEYVVGSYYYAPVFFNVALTFVAARMMYRLALLCNLSKRYAQYLAVFFLVHWDVLAWSSLVNLKDVLLLTLTIAFFTLLIDFKQKMLFSKAVGMGIVFFIFIWIRFYIPLLILGTLGEWYVIQKLPVIRARLSKLFFSPNLPVISRGMLLLWTVVIFLGLIGSMRLLVPNEMFTIMAIVLTICSSMVLLTIQHNLVWWQMALFYAILLLFWRIPAITGLINILFIICFIVPVRHVINNWLYQIRLSKHGAMKYLLVICSLAFMGVVLKVMGTVNIIDGVTQLVLSPLSLAAGILRMLLTPQPWSIYDEHSFLTLPSIFHWILFVPALFSGFCLWRKFPETRLLILYLLTCLLLYGSYEELQGPRHRVQFTFIIAWLQFDFLWLLVKGALAKTAATCSLQRETPSA